jgi:adenosylmethionine-8-amino-7-oxononanoate aminotransferase
MLVLHQILKMIIQFQKLEIKSRREKFVLRYKIYIGKTLANEPQRNHNSLIEYKNPTIKVY